jgi:hypothetical protein
VVEIVFLRDGRVLSDAEGKGNGKARGCGLFSVRPQRRSVVIDEMGRL